MAIFSDSFIKTYKKTVDVAALLNEADYAVLSNLSLQNRCLFELIIYSEPPSAEQTFADTAKQLALDAVGLLVMRLYIVAINDIPLIGLEYQRTGGMNWVKDMIYPDSITMSFMEIGIGAVKKYFKEWQDQIATYNPVTRDYVFNNNQQMSKRKAIIIPQQSDVIPSTQWIMIDGLKYKTLTGLSYDHSSGENEVLTAEFSCDNIRLVGA
jgi:hypothetical protein